MKNFAVNNIEKKANTMLKEHIDVLSEMGANLEWNGGKYHMDMGHNQVFGSVGYDVKNKFLVKTYGLTFDLIFDDVHFNESFNASCSFAGMTKIEGAYFKIRKYNDESVSNFLNESKLIEKIIKLGESLDIESVKVSYSVDTKQLSVKIKPYAGVYLWLKFPPINRQIPLRGPELEALLKFTKFIKSDFSKKLYKN